MLLTAHIFESCAPATAQQYTDIRTHVCSICNPCGIYSPPLALGVCVCACEWVFGLERYITSSPVSLTLKEATGSELACVCARLLARLWCSICVRCGCSCRLLIHNYRHGYVLYVSVCVRRFWLGIQLRSRHFSTLTRCAWFIDLQMGFAAHFPMRFLASGVCFYVCVCVCFWLKPRGRNQHEVICLAVMYIYISYISPVSIGGIMEITKIYNLKSEVVH